MTAVRFVVGFVFVAMVCPESFVSKDNDVHCKRQPPSTPTTTTPPPALSVLTVSKSQNFHDKSKLASIRKQ